MHLTRIKFKDGSSISGYINKWRPVEGYLILLGADTKLYFDDMLEAITEGERVGVQKVADGTMQVVIGDVDELKRANQHRRSHV
jgi:hypothetical protein